MKCKRCGETIPGDKPCPVCGVMTDTLRIVAYVDELGKLLHTDTQRLKSDIALTLHAPAQAAADERDQLRKELDEALVDTKEIRARWNDAEEECAAAVAKLQAEVEALRTDAERLSCANAALLDQMHHFAHADQKLWDESMRAPEDFERWVRSRATHMLAQFNGRASVLDDGGTK